VHSSSVHMGLSNFPTSLDLGHPSFKVVGAVGLRKRKRVDGKSKKGRHRSNMVSVGQRKFGGQVWQGKDGKFGNAIW